MNTLEVRSSSVFGEKCPVKDNADLEAYPHIHNKVHDDESGEGEPVDEAVGSASLILVGTKHPQEANNRPGKSTQ